MYVYVYVYGYVDICVYVNVYITYIYIYVHRVRCSLSRPAEQVDIGRDDAKLRFGALGRLYFHV